MSVVVAVAAVVVVLDIQLVVDPDNPVVVVDSTFVVDKDCSNYNREHIVVDTDMVCIPVAAAGAEVVVVVVAVQQVNVAVVVVVEEHTFGLLVEGILRYMVLVDTFADRVAVEMVEELVVVVVVVLESAAVVEQHTLEHTLEDT